MLNREVKVNKVIDCGSIVVVRRARSLEGIQTSCCKMPELGCMLVTQYLLMRWLLAVEETFGVPSLGTCKE